MYNNKNNVDKIETVLVQIALPTIMHRDLKIEALLRKKGNGRKIDLHSVMLERLSRDLRSFPVQNILAKTAQPNNQSA